MSYWDSADGNLGTTTLIMLCSLSDEKKPFNICSFWIFFFFQKEDDSNIEIRQKFCCGESKRMVLVIKIMLVKVFLVV